MKDKATAQKRYMIKKAPLNFLNACFFIRKVMNKNRIIIKHFMAYTLYQMIYAYFISDGLKILFVDPCWLLVRPHSFARPAYATTASGGTTPAAAKEAYG